MFAKLSHFGLLALLCWTEAAFGQTSALAAKLRGIRWVDFAPTRYNPDTSPPTIPSEEGIRADLRVLRQAGFNGLITYGADLPQLVTIAADEGFESMLLGVWDPGNPQELAQATLSARQDIVLGIICGNEGIQFNRYSSEILKRAMDQLRRDTGKPISTTEVVETFYTGQNLIDWSDFVTVNAHGYFHGYRDPVDAVDWTYGAWLRLSRQIPSKPLFFKELGLPTAAEKENSEANQAEFYFRLLTTTDVAFAFFEAFDQLFKQGALEQSWGLFRADRSPKAAAGVLMNPESCLGPLQRSWCGQ